MKLFLLLSLFAVSMSEAGSITMQWNQEEPPDVDAYNLYWGPQGEPLSNIMPVARPDVKLPNDPNFSVKLSNPGWQEGANYCFQLSALAIKESETIEGGRSETVCATVRLVTPKAPTNLRFQ